MKTWAQGKETMGEIDKQKKKFSPAINFLKNHNLRTAVDIGCGNGWFLKWLKEDHHKLSVLGVEENLDAKKECYKKGILAVSKFPTKKNISLVSLWGCAEHIKDPAALISKCSEIMGDDSHLIICVPNVECDEAKKEKENTYMFTAQHLWYFSMTTLTEFMERQGFDLVYYYGFNNLYQQIGIFKKHVNLKAA